MDIKEIQKIIQTGGYEFRKHALERASERGIDALDITAAILEGEILESYPDDPRGPSCLICGRGREQEDLHVVCGFAENTVWIITAYRPEEPYWIDPRTRRRTI